MGFWNDFKQTGREMYGIPDGETAGKFLASLPVDYVRHTRKEAVSSAYSARRTKGLQAVMNFQYMGGENRAARAARYGEELPDGYDTARDAAHQALEDFPELKNWIDPSSLD